MDPIPEWHIVIMGFLQTTGAVNGMVNVWRQILQTTRGTDARVELRSWNCNLADLAELISRISVADRPPRIVVYGYSWGGMSAALFARHLRRRGLAIDRLVLCDAVYRHWYPFGWWRAFAPWRAIKIPDNVRRVTQFRQRQSWPRGHTILADNPGKTIIEHVRWLQTDHCWMDDHGDFHLACIEAAKGFECDPSNSGSSA